MYRRYCSGDGVERVRPRIIDHYVLLSRTWRTWLYVYRVHHGLVIIDYNTCTYNIYYNIILRSTEFSSKKFDFGFIVLLLFFLVFFFSNILVNRDESGLNRVEHKFRPVL